MCMVGDDDYWTFYNEFTPRARKSHKCGECHRVIEKGERYHTQGGLNDGQFEWHKTCAHCNVASKWLVVACEGYLFGMRQEDFADHVVGHERDLRSAPLTRLLRWMRADWRDRNGDLRSVESVERVTAQAIAAYRRRYQRAVA